MNLDYNDEQTMLRDQIQKFCESEYDFYKREKIVKSTDDFDQDGFNDSISFLSFGINSSFRNSFKDFWSLNTCSRS